MELHIEHARLHAGLLEQIGERHADPFCRSCQIAIDLIGDAHQCRDLVRGRALIEIVQRQRQGLIDQALDGESPAVGAHRGVREIFGDMVNEFGAINKMFKTSGKGDDYRVNFSDR